MFLSDKFTSIRGGTPTRPTTGPPPPLPLSWAYEAAAGGEKSAGSPSFPQAGVRGPQPPRKFWTFYLGGEKKRPLSSKGFVSTTICFFEHGPKMGRPAFFVWSFSLVQLC